MRSCAVRHRWRGCSDCSWPSATHSSPPATKSPSRTGPDLALRVEREGFAVRCAGPTAMEAAMAAMADPAVESAPKGEHWHFAGAMFGDAIAAAKLPRAARPRCRAGRT